MPLNDYKCLNAECNGIIENCIDVPVQCIYCDGHDFEVYFGNWLSMAFDARKDEKTDAKGALKNAGVSDCPLCMANLGLTTNPQLASYNRLGEEKQKELREKFLADGDSSKLRKEVLEAYNKAIGGKFEVQRD